MAAIASFGWMAYAPKKNNKGWLNPRDAHGRFCSIKIKTPYSFGTKQFSEEKVEEKTKEKHLYVQPIWLIELKRRNIREFGRKCSEFAYGCPVCMAWLAWELLDELYSWYPDGKKV